MNIFTLPIRNLKRKLPRTLIMLVVFTIGILSMVAINRVSRVVGDGLEKKLNQFGANILVYPVTDNLHLSYGGFELGSLSYEVRYLSESKVEGAIRNIELSKNISAIAPKLVAPEKVGGTPVMVVGVNWGEEMKIKEHWMLHGAVPDGPSSLLAGGSVAESLGLKHGSSVTIGKSKFSVSGVIGKTGSEDDNVIFMDIHQLQRITDKKGLVNFVEVSALCSACPIEDIVKQISGGLPGVDIRTVQSQVMQRMSAVGFVTRLAGAVSLVIIFTASFMIALFMIASVNERKREIGVLRSLGYSRLSVFTVFCFEALMIGSAAGVLGYVSGYFASFKALEILKIAEDTKLGFAPVQFLLTFLIVTAVSMAASALPAWKATRIEPSEALVAL